MHAGTEAFYHFFMASKAGPLLLLNKESSMCRTQAVVLHSEISCQLPLPSSPAAAASGGQGPDLSPVALHGWGQLLQNEVKGPRGHGPPKPLGCLHFG